MGGRRGHAAPAAATSRGAFGSQLPATLDSALSEAPAPPAMSLAYTRSSQHAGWPIVEEGPRPLGRVRLGAAQPTASSGRGRLPPPRRSSLAARCGWLQLSEPAL